MQKSAQSAVIILYRIRMNNAVIKTRCVFDVFVAFVAVLKKKKIFLFLSLLFTVRQMSL